MPTILARARGKLLWETRLAVEKLRGLDFSAIVEPKAVGLDPATSFRSSPSGGKILANVFRSLPLSPDAAVIDIGCGKGSAMRTLLELPFRQVAGIELSPAIADIARRNFARLNEPRAHVITGDAAAFDGYLDFSFFYLYNPFPAHVVADVARKIAAVAAVRPVFVVYNNPTGDGCFRQSPAFRHISSHRSEHGHDIKVYASRS